jgi:two-component system phosphate regulon sensor histidine kinase PhoR
LIPVIDKDVILSVIVVIKDITLDAKLESLKTELVTNISHELKTPLTSIQGYSELLIENSKDLSAMDIKYLKKILKNSNKLISIYDSLLSLSNIENSNDLLKQEIDFRELANSSFEKLKTSYKKSSSKIQFNLDFSTIKVNEDLFETVIYNILENSFKYSKDDLKINVSLQTEGHSVVIKFTDNGIGISSDKKDQIFQRFYRINESRSDEIQGLGLGLSLVKNIIEKHSGSVQVGETTNGTEIILIIPR